VTVIHACEYCGRLRWQRFLKQVVQPGGVTWKWGCKNARRCMGRQGTT